MGHIKAKTKDALLLKHLYIVLEMVFLDLATSHPLKHILY